jgi:hypothetical protein
LNLGQPDAWRKGLQQRVGGAAAEVPGDSLLACGIDGCAR